MRWEELLDQLEGQWVQLSRATAAEEISDLREAEAATITLTSRLLGAGGEHLTIGLRQGDEVSGMVLRVGMDWVLIESRGQQCLIPFHGIAYIRRLGAGGGELEGIAKRVSAHFLIRELARRHAHVAITLPMGSIHGVLISAGSDYMDVSEKGLRHTVLWDAVCMLRAVSAA